MHSTQRTTTRRHDGREWLGLLLLATPLASALAWLTGWTDYVVFGVTPGWRTAAAALGVVAWTATWVRRPSPTLRDEQLSKAARLLALAMLQGWVIERYSTGFYTSRALVEGITILLVVHLAAEILRRADGTQKLAAIGDDLSLGAAVCLAAFWLAAAGGWHSFAAVALLLSVPHLALVTVFRGLVALRSSRRTASTAPVVVLAAGLSLSLAPAPAYADAETSVLRQSPAIRLVLNVPATRLDVFRAGSLERSYRVAVGAPSYATPLGDHEIVRIVWNPWWYPPDSPWARSERVTPPGPGNPMGRVKLSMRGLYYLHGTPFDESIGQACSHGCIRMHDDDAIALARMLQRETGAAITDAAVDVLTSRSRATREVVLPRPVPIRLVYELAEVRGDTLLVYPDIYRRGRGTVRSRVLRVLAERQIDTVGIDSRVLDSVARQARSGRVIVPLATLSNPAPEDATSRRRVQ